MRLIDADALLEELRTQYGIGFIWSVIDLVTNAPTVQREGWVSVDDGLPDNGKEIIGCNVAGGIWIETFDKDEPLGYMKYWQYAPSTPTDME